MNNRSIFAKFVAELRRRDVIRTGIAYIGFSWLLLQVLDVASQMLIVDVIVGTFTFIFLMCLFPVVLYVSWHFQFTGRGWVRTAATDFDQDGNAIPAGTPGWGSWLGLIATIVLSLALGIRYFESVKDKLAQEEEGIVKTISASSIAVLPFEDQSPDKDKAYLAVGLAEELTSLLGQTDGFTVAASRSSQLLTEKGLAAVDIGRRLKVETVLTGSVVNIGNRVKVRVELLNTENGHTLWTENFLRELKDIFELQAEIGRSLVNTLQDTYLETGSLRSLSSTNSTDAYVIYLKGKEAYRKQTAESMKEARKLFEQAITLDPEYAQAYVGLADTIVLLGDGESQFGVLDNEIATTLAERNIEKALVREPNIPMSYAVLGVIAMLRGQLDGAINAFDKAIELNSSLAIAYMWKYYTLIELQRFDEGLVALKKAHELDPLFNSTTYNLGFELSAIGEYEQAKAVYEQLKFDHPDYSYTYIGLADIHFGQGDYYGAVREAKIATELSPDHPEFERILMRSLLQLNLGDIVRSLSKDPTWEATILLQAGDHEQLFKKMEFEMASNPDDYWKKFEAGWYHSMVGDPKLAASLIMSDYKHLNDNELYAMPYCTPAIEIAWALKISQETSEFESVLKECEKRLNEQFDAQRTYNELYFLAARLEALKDNPSGSLAMLQESVKMGWREWWTDKDPILSKLTADPLFQSQLKVITDDLNEQREKARSLY